MGILAGVFHFTMSRKPVGIVFYLLALFLIGCSADKHNPGTDSAGGGNPLDPGNGTSTVSISIASPASNGSYTASSSTVTISGTTTGIVSQVSWSSDRDSGGGIASGTSAWTAAGIPLQPGANTIVVTALGNGGGSTASASIVVSYGSSTNKTYYLSASATASDAADGSSAATAWKTFEHAFSSMAGGDELILLDGTYSEANGTGYISYLGVHSAQPPSGKSLSEMTYIHALNPGKVTIDGHLFIGRSDQKVSYVKIRGITFEGGGELYNTSFVTIKDSGFHGAFGIGTNDHHQFNDNNLIEDVWIWASGERIIALNYRSHNNVWRRVLVRGDGCGKPECTGSGNPNVGITIYESNNISFQNVMVVDRILAPGDEPYGDFATAQHDSDASGACIGCYTYGKNEWLGTISIKSPDSGYYFEPDHYDASLVLPPGDPTITMKNVISWNSADWGFNLRRNIPNGLFENMFASAGGGVAIASQASFIYTPASVSNILRNVLVVDQRSNGSYAYTGTGISGSSYANVFNANAYGLATAYSIYGTCTACATSVDPFNATAPSMRYLTRIEAGSVLKGAGFGGADIGANIVYRYGADGSRYGESNYNSLTTTPLWPWPNESRIKQEMCTNTARGFCATGKRLDGVNPVTLTSYVWEQLGNPLPSGIYP